MFLMLVASLLAVPHLHVQSLGGGADADVLRDDIAVGFEPLGGQLARKAVHEEAGVLVRSLEVGGGGDVGEEVEFCQVLAATSVASRMKIVVNVLELRSDESNVHVDTETSSVANF